MVNFIYINYVCIHLLLYWMEKRREKERGREWDVREGYKGTKNGSKGG